MVYYAVNAFPILIVYHIFKNLLEDRMMIIALFIYFLLLLLIGIYANKKTGKTPEDYFLANRSFGPIILFFTIAATNFSAFTFLGFAGKAYTSGFGQYGIMAFGTGMMAIMFYVIGRKVWILGRKRRYLTPAELIGDRFSSPSLRMLFMLVMVAFTIPYLAIQAIGAGYIIQYIFPGISMKFGAILVTIIITFYVMAGGMKASGWTDVLQGVIMIVAMVLAFIFVAHGLGGFEVATKNAHEANPSLFSRPGNGFFTPQIWLSFMLLWIFCDPMFPQIFSRFYTAKSEKSLQVSMIFYPIIVSLLFFFPVIIGIWASTAPIEISGNEDTVLPLMVKNFAPYPVFGFVMLGALAALMSTADSQLLSISSMISHDIPLIKRKKVIATRIMVLLLSLFTIFFVIFSYDPTVGIMGTLVNTTFSGLIVLSPITLAILYWKRVTKWGCIAGIVFGESMVFLYKYIPLPTYGFLPGIIAFLFTTIVMIFVSLFTKQQPEKILDEYFEN